MIQQNEYWSLNWTKNDPDNKIGLFQSGRFSTVNNGLASSSAIVLAGLFSALGFLVLKTHRSLSGI
jgi:hypothetical protein